jgi:DNA-binding MarR family transcriptional regulator
VPHRGVSCADETEEKGKPVDTDDREPQKTEGEYIDALRTWVDVFSERSMRAMLAYVRSNEMSVSQFMVLLFVFRRQGCTMSEIRDSLNVTGAAATQLVDRLEASGFVVRRAIPTDRRVRLVEVTEDGRRYVHAASAARDRWFRAVADALTPAERHEAVPVLQALTRATRTADGVEA